MTELNVAQRSVTKTRLFWVGVALMPYVFAWFTLSKKYGVLARIVAFGWMIVVIMILADDKDLMNKVQNSSDTKEINNFNDVEGAESALPMCLAFLASIPKAYLKDSQDNSPCKADALSGTAEVELSHPRISINFHKSGYLWFTNSKPYPSHPFMPDMNRYDFNDVYFPALRAAGHSDLPELKYVVFLVGEAKAAEPLRSPTAVLTKLTRCIGSTTVEISITGSGSGPDGGPRVESLSFEPNSCTNEPASK